MPAYPLPAFHYRTNNTEYLSPGKGITTWLYKPNSIFVRKNTLCKKTRRAGIILGAYLFVIKTVKSRLAKDI